MTFDVWFSERSLHEGPESAVERALAQRRAGRSQLPSPTARCGCARATSATTRTACSCAARGEPTYFAADIAYLEDKLERGFERLIDVARAPTTTATSAAFKAACAALGDDPDRLELPILQFVHLVESGERGVDVQAPRRVRHARRPDRRDRRRRRALLPAPALARHDDRPRPRPRARASRPRTPSTTSSTRTRGSPRCCARRARSGSPRALTRRPATALGAAIRAERELIKKLLAFPAEVAEAADRRAPHRIATYALELAQTFTRLLPRLPGRRRRAGGRRVVPPRPVRGVQAHDRPLARPARRLRAGHDVAS